MSAPLVSLPQAVATAVCGAVLFPAGVVRGLCRGG